MKIENYTYALGKSHLSLAPLMFIAFVFSYLSTHMPWILNQRDRFIAKPFCAFCRTYTLLFLLLHHRHDEPHLFDRTWCVLRISLYTHTPADTHKTANVYFKTLAHTPHRLYRLVNILFGFFFFFVCWIWLLYCVRPFDKSNLIDRKKKRFRCFNTWAFYTTHHTSDLLIISFCHFILCALSPIVWHSKLGNCLRGSKLPHHIKWIVWFRIVSMLIGPSFFLFCSGLRCTRFSRYEYTNWISTEKTRKPKSSHTTIRIFIII